MAFFTNLKTSLKQKWLQYFQLNRSWIARQMEVEHVTTPDGGRRPSSHLIVGVVSVLEPQLSELLMPFAQLNPDVNALIDVLELNFDPDRGGGNPSTSSNFTANSRAIDDPDTTVNALMGITAQEEPETPSSSLPVEVVDKTVRGDLQQQPFEQADTSRSQGDLWLDELNQDRPQSEPIPDNTRARQERRSEDEEISRLFPEF